MGMVVCLGQGPNRMAPCLVSVTSGTTFRPSMRAGESARSDRPRYIGSGCPDAGLVGNKRGALRPNVGEAAAGLTNACTETSRKGRVGRDCQGTR